MSVIIKAIKKINSNAVVTVYGSDINTCTIKYHDGTPEISKSEIKDKITEVEKEDSDAKIAKENKKASGKQKLKDLGLDDDEIQALMGV